MKSVLECRELEKAYRNGVRIGPLSFLLAEDEVIGLLGENGAGKTTLLEMIAGLRRPTGGSLALQMPAEGGRVGYLPHRLSVYSWMKGSQALDFTAGFYPTWDMNYARSLAERLRLDLKPAYGELSRGNQTKLGLICALAHNPPLLLLDEPTAGLDPIVKREFTTAILEHRRDRRCAVILSSHVFEDLVPLATRYLLIKTGRIIDDTPAEEVAAQGVADWFWQHYPIAQPDEA